MKPGIFTGISMAEYLRIPAVSAGLLISIDQRCPLAGWHESWLNPHREEDDSTAAQGIGTLAHEVLLEGSTDCLAVIDPNDYPGERGGVPKGWTNKSIRAARDAAIAAGKVPVFPEKVQAVKSMVAAANAYIDSLRESEPAIWAAMQPGGGESEVVIVWQERDGTLCKIRPDRISLDRRALVNYKTTLASAEPDSWFRRQAASLGYPLASAFYRRGVEQALKIDEPVEVWLAQEQDAPHLCSLVGLDPMGLHAAQMRMMRALRTWAACAASGRWPGYPSQVAYPETPPWDLARAEEEDIPRGIPYEPEKLWGKARGGFADEHAPAV